MELSKRQFAVGSGAQARAQRRHHRAASHNIEVGANLMEKEATTQVDRREKGKKF